MNNEIENLDLELKDHIENHNYFCVTCSIKQYSKSGNNLLLELANTTEAFAYSNNENAKKSLVESGWVLKGKRYELVKNQTILVPRDFSNMFNTFVFNIDPKSFDLNTFFSYSKEPFVIYNVSSGINKNAWRFAKNAALKKNKLIFCTSATSPSMFTILFDNDHLNSTLKKYV